MDLCSSPSHPNKGFHRSEQSPRSPLAAIRSSPRCSANPSHPDRAKQSARLFTPSSFAPSSESSSGRELRLRAFRLLPRTPWLEGSRLSPGGPPATGSGSGERTDGTVTVTTVTTKCLQGCSLSEELLQQFLANVFSYVVQVGPFRLCNRHRAQSGAPVMSASDFRQGPVLQTRLRFPPVYEGCELGDGHLINQCAVHGPRRKEARPSWSVVEGRWLGDGRKRASI